MNENTPLIRKTTPVKFKRSITLVHAIGIIVGTVIGSGIFVAPSGVFQFSGSLLTCLSIWLFTGLYCLGQALCYAELGTVLPKSGGAYIYIINILGEIPAFLCAWIHIFVNATSSLAVLLRIFASYILQPFNVSCNETLITATTITCLITVAMLNARSVSLAAKLQALFAFTKILSIILVISFGCYHIAIGGYKNFTPLFHSNDLVIGNLSRAVLKSYFAYKGWLVFPL